TSRHDHCSYGDMGGDISTASPCHKAVPSRTAPARRTGPIVSDGQAGSLPPHRIRRDQTMNIRRTTLLGALLATVMTVGTAQAASFRWANDGDVGAMDP